MPVLSSARRTPPVLVAVLAILTGVLLPLVAPPSASAATGTNGMVVASAPPPQPSSVLRSGNEGEDIAVRQGATPVLPATSGSAHAIFVLEPRAGVASRHFDYVDRLSPGQRSYSLAAAPMLGVGGAIYPFASLGNPVLRAFGFVGELSRAVALESASPNGARVETSWSNFDIALRGRISVGERVTLGARGGYGVLDFAFGNVAAPASAGSELPGATYRYLKGGVDARFELWSFALIVGLDYLAVQGASGVAERYPHATVGGIDAMVGIGIPFARHFEARTGVRYQRFFYSMHPVVGDARVAGGAMDEYGRWDTSIAFHWN